MEERNIENIEEAETDVIESYDDEETEISAEKKVLKKLIAGLLAAGGLAVLLHKTKGKRKEKRIAREIEELENEGYTVIDKDVVCCDCKECEESNEENEEIIRDEE